MKSKWGKGLAMLLSAVMMIGTVLIGDVGYVRAEPRNIILSIKCDEKVIPPEGSTAIKIWFYGEGDSDLGNDTIAGNADGTENWRGVEIPSECVKAKIQVESAGYDVFHANEDVKAIDNVWKEGRTLSIGDVANDYHFELTTSDPEKQIPAPETINPSDIPSDENWSYDTASKRYRMVINDSNPGDSFTNIVVPTNYDLVIAKDYHITGKLTLMFSSRLIIEKDCSVSADNGIEINNMVQVVLGNAKSATGFTNLYKEEGEGLVAYNTAELNNTVFEENDKNQLIDTTGRPQDCGMQLSLNSNSELGEHKIDYCEVSYKVYGDGDTSKEPDASGSFSDEWVPVNLDPSIFKKGTTVVFHVATKTGYKLLENGVRFPNNKNVISNKEDETKSSTREGYEYEFDCSYTLTYNPDAYVSVTIDIVPISDPEKTLADFQWTTDRAALASPDGYGQYVSHGTIEISKVIDKSGTEINPEEAKNPESAPYWTQGEMEEISDWQGNKWQGYRGAFEVGTTVVVKIVPERGYQLTRFTISDIEGSTTPVDGEEGLNSYTFVLNRPDAYNLGAVFTKVEDRVDASTASNISGGSVVFAADEISNGSMALNVSDATPSTDEMAKFNEMAEDKGYSVKQCVNLESEQRFYKGVDNASRDQCWVINKSELKAPAKITLDVSGITGDEVVVLHNHNGAYEEIQDVTYSNGKLTFSAQSFSDFAIASKGEKPAPAPSTPSSSSSSDSKSEEEVAPVVAQPTTLGTVVGGTTVRNWDDLEKVMATKTVATAKTKAEKTAAKAPLVLVLNQRNATVPVSTIQALQKSDASSLHLMLGNGAAITISNGAGLKNQGAINLTNKVTQTKNSKTITFNANTKLLTLGALHMSVPKNVTEAKLYYVLNRQSVYLGTFKPVNGQVFFPINQLGTYQLVY